MKSIHFPSLSSVGSPQRSFLLLLTPPHPLAPLSAALLHPEQGTHPVVPIPRFCPPFRAFSAHFFAWYPSPLRLTCIACANRCSPESVCGGEITFFLCTSHFKSDSMSTFSFRRSYETASSSVSSVFSFGTVFISCHFNIAWCFYAFRCNTDYLYRFWTE